MFCLSLQGVMDPGGCGRRGQRKPGPDEGHRPAFRTQEGAASDGGLHPPQVHLERRPGSGRGQTGGPHHPRCRATFRGRGLPVPNRPRCSGARGQCPTRNICVRRMETSQDGGNQSDGWSYSSSSLRLCCGSRQQEPSGPSSPR